MKRLTLIFASLLAAGCAANRPSQLTQQSAGPVAPEGTYRPAAASALVFASPVGPAFPLAGLDRDAREPSAFFGYDQGITENYFLFTDDEQSDFPGADSYDREAVSAKFGTLSR